MAALNNEFNPTDQELINDYLVNKVHCNPLPSTKYVFNLDVYGDRAYGDCEYWRKHFEILDDEYILYFFTSLRPKSENDDRIHRRTVNGRWKNEQQPTDIEDDDGNIIGTKGNFSFIPNEGVPELGRAWNWVMHEYRLSSRYSEELEDNLDALWKIRKKPIRKKMGRNGMTADYVPPEEELSQKMMDLENTLRGDGQI